MLYRVVLNRNFFFLISIFIFLFAFLACNQSDQYKKAIERVLSEDSKTLHGLDNYPEEKKRRVVVNRMLEIDLKGCPHDFKQAYIEHIKAWDSIATYAENKGEFVSSSIVKSIDKGSKEGFWSGAWDLFKRGVEDSNNVNEINSQVQSSWINVKQVALKYDAEI